jgi:hypothetical protein
MAITITHRDQVKARRMAIDSIRYEIDKIIARGLVDSDGNDACAFPGTYTARWFLAEFKRQLLDLKKEIKTLKMVDTK